MFRYSLCKANIGNRPWFFRLPEPVQTPKHKVDLSGYRAVAMFELELEDLASELLPHSMLEVINPIGCKGWQSVRNARASGKDSAEAKDGGRVWIETVSGPMEQAISVSQTKPNASGGKVKRYNELVDLKFGLAIEKFQLDMTFIRNAVEWKIPGTEKKVMHVMVEKWRQEGAEEW